MPAGARCLKAKEVGAPDQRLGKVGPLDPAVPQRRFAEPGFTKAALAEVATGQIQIHPIEISQPQALELTPTLCQGEA